MADFPMPLDLASRLNAARRDRGWTIHDMAHRCEISPELAHQIFTGKQSPSRQIAERLIERLGVDVDTARDLRSLSQHRYVAVYGSTSIPLSLAKHAGDAARRCC
jgi:transcriptional regulator with XRE-family HTH domain